MFKFLKFLYRFAKYFLEKKINKKKIQIYNVVHWLENFEHELSELRLENLRA